MGILCCCIYCTNHINCWAMVTPFLSMFCTFLSVSLIGPISDMCRTAIQSESLFQRDTFLYNYDVAFLLIDQQHNTLTAPEPPSKQKLNEIRAQREHQVKTRTMIKEFIQYSIFMFLISFIAFGQKDSISYRMNNGLITLLGLGEKPGQTSFTQV